ncbi:MAG: hypothetical protein JW969_06200 [Spirochaetales bacterium]|nr:hypothetical protein [Spirochaetales bacterium]
MKKVLILSACIFSVSVLITVCTLDDELISSKSYSGHESDMDANNFVRAFPSALGSRLDNCQTCHKGAAVVTSSGKGMTIDNPCSYCHIRVFESPDDYSSGYPVTFEDTLNGFGLDYKDAGRTRQAMESIKDTDSDSDGYSNIEEINELRFPGDNGSMPGQPIAPVIELSMADIKAMTYHEQFMLFNTTKQQYDEYVNYGGVKISDFFSVAGVDLTGADGFTVFAPDGYQISFLLGDFDHTSQYPDGVFYQIDQSGWETDRKFMIYPDTLPPGVANNDPLDDLYMLIAYKRNGVDLDSSYYDPVDGRIGGEGPFRIVRPQMSNDNGDTMFPFRPDRGSKSANYGDGWDFLGSGYDHNAGDAVKGTCVIRIDPMPAGYEEYDWKNGWDLIMDEKIIIYGYNVTED